MPSIFGSILSNLSINIPRRIGKATLSLGSAVVTDSQITTDDVIILTGQNGGILGGIVRVSAINPGVSFTILSTNLLDTAVIGYVIF